MENDPKIKEIWWKPAITVFANVSVWIVVPILVALFLGKYLDSKYDSGHRFFFILIAVAFLVTIFGLVKILCKYLKKFGDEVKPK
jgi:membrane protease YdiL (CAAX protease family)